MARLNPQIVKLLFGPIGIPKFHRGARVFCQQKDHDVTVTDYTNARISWPKGRAWPRVAGNHRSLLMMNLLAPFTRRGPPLPVGGLVWASTATINAGSKRLQLINSEKGAKAVRGVRLSAEAVERRRRTALELGLRPTNGYGGSKGMDEQVMLGTISDEVLARKLDRSTRAVRLKRTRLGKVKQAKRRWTAKEDALLGLPAVEVTRLTGRTGCAIYARRKLLNLKRRHRSASNQSSTERHYDVGSDGCHPGLRPGGRKKR